MEEKVKNSIEKSLNDAGYILTNVIYEKENGSNFLRIFIDKKNDYINVNDCITVNGIINPILDKLDLI